MNNKRNFLTDSMSLRVISPAIKKATLVYERLTDEEEIREFLTKRREYLESKLKRQGYSVGLRNITGMNFPVTDDVIFDVAYGDTSVNVGISNPTRYDIEDQGNWEKGLFVPELRIITIEK